MTTNQLNILFDEDTLTGASVNLIVKVALFGVLCIVQVRGLQNWPSSLMGRAPLYLWA